MSKEHKSPTGLYTLTISNEPTKPGCWDYTIGTITNKDGKVLFIVKRNYSSFPFTWIEQHSNGHDYLICGENYQGQTVLELDTEKRKDFLPEEIKKGAGFCWAQYRFDRQTQLMIVAGCYWACPYEFRFYDFSDPMSGWPEIELENECIDDARWPAISDNGDIQTFQTEPEPEDIKYYPEDEYADDDVLALRRPIAAITTYRRQGNKLIVVESWVSEKEKQRRKDWEEGNRKYNEWIENYRTTNELYLTCEERLKDKTFSPEEHYSIGYTYSGWCPDFQGNERSFHKRIVSKHKKYTVDLEWATETGPIKLTIYKNSKHLEDKIFEHSVDGMNKAFAYTKNLLYSRLIF